MKRFIVISDDSGMIVYQNFTSENPENCFLRLDCQGDTIKMSLMSRDMAVVTWSMHRCQLNGIPRMEWRDVAKGIKMEKELFEILKELNEHLDWIGWGDSYERSCVGDLPKRVDEIIEKYNGKALSSSAEPGKHAVPADDVPRTVRKRKQ